MPKKAKKKAAKKKTVKLVKKTVAKRKVGRPKRVFTAAQIKKMGELAYGGCQNNTIAGLMDIPKETIVANFGQFLWKKRCERKQWLRECQDQSAEDGAIPMQIFLGKNELGQADKNEVEHSGSGKLLPPVIE